MEPHSQRPRTGTTHPGTQGKCTLCKQGETKPGETTITFQRGETTIIVKSVPAEICDNCGEYYLTQAITGKALRMAEEAVARGAEVEILRFAA